MLISFYRKNINTYLQLLNGDFWDLLLYYMPTIIKASVTHFIKSTTKLKNSHYIDLTKYHS